MSDSPPPASILIKTHRWQSYFRTHGTFIDSKNPAAAIPKCDAVINAYKAYYGALKEKIYCARSGPETLGSLLKAAVDKNDAIGLTSTWSDAYFMKAYALQDLRRLNDAKGSLDTRSISLNSARYTRSRRTGLRP